MKQKPNIYPLDKVQVDASKKQGEVRIAERLHKELMSTERRTTHTTNKNQTKPGSKRK